MKRCPQCNSVFEDTETFCPNDSTPLVEETFVLPSEASAVDEEPTLIHHDPITIEIPNPNQPAPAEQFNYPNLPPETVVPVVIRKPRNTAKYLLFLVIGLVLGGGLVLAAIAFAMVVFRNKPIQVTNTNVPVNSTTPTPKPTATPVTASAKHENHTDAADDEFNGRVISKNAYVRSSPSRSARQIDVLPVDDRLEIEERASGSSPWFRVTCEHGTTGWMHGNTIEYTH